MIYIVCEHTVTIVVGPQDDEDILNKGNECNGIDDERQASKKVLSVGDAIGEGAVIDV